MSKTLTRKYLVNHTYNQRTNGPVNAHRISGLCIDLHAFIHVFSPREEADNLTLWIQTFNVNRNS